MKNIKHNNPVSVGIVFLLLVAQRFIFGVNYYPTVDDWFLYLGKSVLIPQDLQSPTLPLGLLRGCLTIT